MDGLSIKEAANILGVPKGRVWELIARGVLVGTPEAGGMRVYLQGKRAEAVPAPRLEPQDEKASPRTNGNGGLHEASPFREMLTEFRNLTERYGQALLALGEARGEVAALRSRVELLEARIDLRLPPAPPFVSWSPPQESPSTTEPPAERPPAETSADVKAESESESMTAEVGPELAELPEPAAAPEPPEPLEAGEASVQEESDEESEPRTRGRPRIRPRHRRRPSRRVAMEGIAMALARAEDPSVAELPGADEAGAAFSAYRASVVDEPTLDVAEEPDQLEATDSVATSEPIPDAFLGDDALGDLVTDEVAPTIEPSAVAPEMAEEATNEEPGIDAMSPRDEGPAAAEPAIETPVYSSEWDEPDWIAEEDLDSWDMAGGAIPAEPTVTEASGVTDEAKVSSEEPAETSLAVDVPVEIGAAAAPPEPPMTAQGSTEDSDEFVADAIADAFVEPTSAADGSAEADPSDPVEESAAVVTSAIDDAWASTGDEPINEAPAHNEAPSDEATPNQSLANGPTSGEQPSEGASQAFVESAMDAAWQPPEAIAVTAVHEDSPDGIERDPEPMEAIADEEIFASNPAEVMTALVESGVALPALEPMTLEPPESAEAPLDQANEAAAPTTDAGTTETEGAEAGPAKIEPAPPVATDIARSDTAPAPTADTTEEELMWLGDEFSSDSRREWRAASSDTAPITPAEDRALNQLAAERGWDDSELRAIRSLLAQPPTSPLETGPEDAVPLDLGQADLAVADTELQDAHSPAGPEAEASAEGDHGPEAAGLPVATAPPEVAAPSDLDAQPEAAAQPQRASVAESMEPDADDEVMDWEQSPSAWTPPAGRTPTFELPGAQELDEALAAVSRPKAPPSEPSDTDVRRTGSITPAPNDPSPPMEVSGPASEPARSWAKPPPTFGGDQPPSPSAPLHEDERGEFPSPPRTDDEDWLAGRRGPAANAYRRLRRLFPR